MADGNMASTGIMEHKSSAFQSNSSGSRQSTLIEKYIKILIAVQHVLDKYLTAETKDVNLLWQNAIKVTTKTEDSRLPIVVVGGSGAGKSTLIGALAGEISLYRQVAQKLVQQL